MHIQLEFTSLRWSRNSNKKLMYKLILWMITGLNVVIIPQQIEILNHYVIYLKLYFKYNSIKKNLNPILDQQIPWDVLQKQTKYHSTEKLSKSGENMTTTEKNQKQKPD